MHSRIGILIGIVMLVAGCFLYAQQTTPDPTPEPKSLYPQPGPGDRMIAAELQRTNALLEESNRLLTEQNQILKQILAKSTPQPPQN